MIEHEKIVLTHFVLMRKCELLEAIKVHTNYRTNASILQTHPMTTITLTQLNKYILPTEKVTIAKVFL